MSQRVSRTKRARAKKPRKTVFDGQTRNSRQKRAGLAGMRVGKVERRVRSKMHRAAAEAGLFTQIAAVQDYLMEDLLERAEAYRREGTMLTSVHLAQALIEPNCMVARFLRCRRIGGIYLRPPSQTSAREQRNGGQRKTKTAAAARKRSTRARR